jgi:hypothetical protein
MEHRQQLSLSLWKSLYLDRLEQCTFHLIARSLVHAHCLLRLLVTGLSPGTAYTVYVWALNGVGYSEGGSRSFTTLSLSKPSSPRDLAVSNITTTFAFVTWSAPLNDGNSPISGYQVGLSYAPPTSADPFPLC